MRFSSRCHFWCHSGVSSLPDMPFSRQKHHNPISLLMITFIFLVGLTGATWGVLSGKSWIDKGPLRPSETLRVAALGVTRGVTFSEVPRG